MTDDRRRRLAARARRRNQPDDDHPTLFPPAVPAGAYRGTQRTSQAAAATQTTTRTAARRRRILELLAAYPDGLTDEEIQRKLDIAGNSQRPARVGLVTAGLVADSGATRATASGRRAIVWKAISR